jgi:hypothetical protein
MADRVLEKNLACAREAVAYARKALWLGAGNFWNDTQDPRFVARLKGATLGLGLAMGPLAPVGMLEGALYASAAPELLLIARRLNSMPADFQAWVQEKFDKQASNYYQQKEQERIAETGQSIAIGNCMEHAAVVFVYLRDICALRPRPLEVMHTNDHAFVVIGRENKNALPGRQWGTGAVICDAYYNEVYQYAGQLNRRQSGARLYKARVVR